MFKHLGTDNGTVTIMLNDQPVTAPVGINVWSAMALAAQPVTRFSDISGAARSAFCGMGTCFDCLVEIDGQPNMQACLTTIRDGMNIRTQGGSNG